MGLAAVASASAQSYDFEGATFGTDWSASVSGAGATLSNTAPAGLGNPTTNGTVDGAYDYVSRGFALAPGSGTGSSRGLYVSANDAATGAIQSAAAVWQGVTLSGEFILKFDSWTNFAGTTGTSEFMWFSIFANAAGTAQTPTGGSTGSTTLLPTGGVAPFSSGLSFGLTGDGGFGRDLRHWRGSTEILPTALDLANNPAGWQAEAADIINRVNYAGGTPLNTWYDLTWPNAGGSTGASRPGNRWLSHTIEVSGGFLSWTVLDPVNNPAGTNSLILRRALTVDDPLSGTLVLGHMDITSGQPGNGTGSTFTLYDNISVTPVPEPGTIAALGLGAAALLRRRKKA